MQVNTNIEVTVTLTLSGEEAAILCAALGSHQRMTTNAYTSRLIGQREKDIANRIRSAVAESLPDVVPDTIRDYEPGEGPGEKEFAPEFD